MRHAATALLLLSLTAATALPGPCLANAIKPAIRLIKSNRAAVQAGVRRAGAPVEVHRNNSYRLLVTKSGGFAVQRLNKPDASVKPVRLNLFFPHGKFPTLNSDTLVQQIQHKLLQPAVRLTERVAKKPVAILPDGTEVAPSSHGGGYHGTNEISPKNALKFGLPAKGNDWRLKEHSEAAGGSAFRGTTPFVYEPTSGQGAAAWAGEGGWVFQIAKVPTWDVNALLAGRVERPVGFRGNLMHGECEMAIPAKVKPEQIKAYGKVVADQQGRLKVDNWIQNPKFGVPAGRTAH